MSEVLIAGICLIIGSVIGFIVGVFVYRNNEKIFSPIADRLDVHEDNLEQMLRNLKSEIATLNKKVSTLVYKSKEK